MQTAPGERLSARTASRLERSGLAALVAAFVVIVALGAAAAVRNARDLNDRRTAIASQAVDPAQAAGDSAEAFRAFRRALGDGSRFALVYGDDVGRDQRGFYRLFGNYYLYPAVAVARPEDADAVMVFGEPSAGLRDAFGEIGQVAGVWLGKRREAR